MIELFDSDKFKRLMEVFKAEIGAEDGNAEGILMLTAEKSGLTRFANNTIHQNVGQNSRWLSVKVIKDKKIGQYGTNRLDEESVKNAAQEALKALEFTPADPELPDLQSSQDYKDIKKVCEATANMSPVEKAEIVKNAVEICKMHDLEAAGILESGVETMMLGNTAGLFAENTQTQVDFNISVYGEKQTSGWAQGCSYSKKELNLDKIAKTAIDKALMAKDPVSMEPGEYTVVLEPSAVSDFMMFLGWLGFGAQGFIEGTSPMKNKLGEKIANELITIEDNVYHPKAIGMPFDFEGSPRQKVTLIENGVFKNIVHSRRTAKKMDTKTTGHALPEPNTHGPLPLNMVIREGDKTQDELIKSTKKGLLVTHFHYVNLVDPNKLSITGMTRDGLFLIEDGKVTKPVNNFRFTESIFKALKNVVALGDELKLFYGYGTSYLAPAMKIENFRFSSKTEF
ncbi:MAG: TldD/PmbA family protein [Candidatus Zixiibacteriota bacterium]